MAGSKTLYSKWLNGMLYFYTAAGLEICHFDGTNRKLVLPSGATLDISAATALLGGAVINLRSRTLIAAVNAGASLVAAVAGLKPRLIEVLAISVGGAAAAVTTVDILGTQSASGVKLAAFAQASLTQSTVLRPGVAGCAVLADGASFVQNDVNTAITIGKTGASITTATAIDTILSYALEP